MSTEKRQLPRAAQRFNKVAAALGMRRRLAGRWLPEDCLRLRLQPGS